MRSQDTSGGGPGTAASRRRSGRPAAGRLGLALAFLAAPARAHDAWADGSPVPAWVKASCCGPQDAHRLDPRQVHRVEGGYIVDGYPRVVPTDVLLPSHDGAWWIFYKRSADGAFSRVYCFFGPMDF